ncbi:MAG: ABC transporter permease subunit [Nitrososphaeria archaeon]
MRNNYKDSLTRYILVIPTLIPLFFLTIYPFLYMIYISFTNFSLFYDIPPKFIGIENYINIISDSFFWTSLKATFYFVVFTVLIEFLLGLFLALLFNVDFKGRKILRVLLLIPMMLPPVGVAMIWRLLLNREIGVVNYFFSLIGIGKIDFLGSKDLAIWSLIITDVWMWTPFVFLMLLAGLQSIPLELYESSKVDGASTWQQLKIITLPLLKSTMIITIVLRLIDVFKVFDYIYVLTAGGPGFSTSFLPYYIYLAAFNSGKMGYAASLSIILLLIIIVITSLIINVLKLPYHLGFREVEKTKLVKLKTKWKNVEILKKKVINKIYKLKENSARIISLSSSFITFVLSPINKLKESYGKFSFIKKFLLYLILILVISIYLFPLYWNINVSFQRGADIFSYPPLFWPPNPEISNYILLISKQYVHEIPLGFEYYAELFPPYFINTLACSFIATVIALIIGSLTAYSIIRYRTGGTGLLNWILSIRFLPPIVTILPLYLIYRSLNLLNTWIGVILSYFIINIPLIIWVMVPFIKDLPQEIEEAAYIDGAGVLNTLFKIVLPLSKPGLVTAFLLSMIFCWNQFLLPFILTFDITSQTLPILITSFITERSIKWQLLAAANILNILPVIILALFCEKYIIKGLTMGAVKG